ncbi:hypothetical protein GIB67_020749 [Kingdonia uniflora]|uniref:Uncharacterized protein n=1 Tax=Kingdonia uniflora TaxID=39325 RepID=A0A7J7M727_9MAGN|nr:hypothetical protein GIB67_020749 [Kingdonia uniflora]
MAEVDIDMERKRRLPLWMLGVVKADQLRNSNDPKDEKDTALVETRVNRKRLKEKNVVCEKGFADGKLNGLVKCGSRKWKKNVGVEDIDDLDGDVHDDVGGVSKKRVKKSFGVVDRTVRGSARLQKGKEESSGVSSRKGNGEEWMSEEEELTIDDLVSIAEEYVEADNEERRQTEATTEPEPQKQLPRSPAFYGTESEATQSSGSLQSYTTLKSSSNSTITKLWERETSGSQDIIRNPVRTGDSTQDMLDLFLGPLLVKPQTEKRKLGDVCETIPLNCEFREPSQSEVLETNMPPVTKKKSSLRDKVAMFFD